MDERQEVVIVSAFQDYRTKKRASIQHVADGLASKGYKVSFVSARYSRMSRRTGDSRLNLDDKANRVERVNGIDCYLWKTAFHPFATRNRLLDRLMTPLFPVYAALPNRVFDTLLKRASYVIVESSVAAIFLRRIRRQNAKAKIIYYATDRLDTVGAHPYVSEHLVRNAGLLDHVSLRSAGMIDHFGFARDRLYRATFGINENEFGSVGPSPYDTPLNAVSVGSMLFDESFFRVAAERMPEMQFHVIGCGTRMASSGNVHVYDEMKFSDTLPFVKHATVGIAPYRPATGSEYLAESSLKLAQFEYFALPSVCPHFAVGDNPTRFGYEPGDGDSIERALRQAVDASGTVEPRRFPSWAEVAMQVLTPEASPDLKL